MPACPREKKRYEDALEFAEKALPRNWHSMKVRTLKAALMRKLDRDNTALIEESLSIDPLYMGCLYEKAVSSGTFQFWKEKMRREAHNYLELSYLYKNAGMYEDALRILSACESDNPMLFYYRSSIHLLMGDREAALTCAKRAESAPSDYCFPNRTEEYGILMCAVNLLGSAPMAHYYLGNLLYDKKQYEKAIGHWEVSLAEKPDFATTCRNLAIAYYNKKNMPEKAMEMMEKACRLDSTYPRLWLEYDQLAAKLCVPVKQRLETMESHPEITAQRDDLYLRYITLLNGTGRYEDALAALNSRRFHPWEGGEGKVSAQYRFALIHQAEEKLAKNEPEKAFSLLESSLTYPENLGEGKLPNVPDNEACYYMGKACRMMGQEEESVKYFRLAASGSQEPSAVLYYNDQPSDYIYYQGLAYRELGEENAARKSFHQLIIYGEKHLFDKVSYDFFAVSLPEIEVFQDDLQLRNTQYCCYLRALGAAGLGEKENAVLLLEEIVRKQNDHFEAEALLQEFKKL